MFVLQAQNEEMMGERSTYQKYVAQLKNRIAQLEEKLQEAEDGDGEERGRRRGRGREEVLRLRRENAELRQKNEKLLASEREVSQFMLPCRLILLPHTKLCTPSTGISTITQQ